MTRFISFLSILFISLTGVTSYGSFEGPLALVDKLSIYYPRGQIHRQSKGRLEDYFAFIKGGEYLRERCKSVIPHQFSSFSEEQRATNIILSTLQYVGLKYTVHYLKAYANKLALVPSEVQNMADYLTQNYCSPNMTLISQKELVKNIVIDYKNEKYKIEKFSDLTLSPEKLFQFDGNRDFLEREFLILTKLFRAFCSYGGRVNHSRLLPKFLKDESIMSYIINGMDEKRWHFFDSSGKIELESTPFGIQVGCDDDVCRRTNYEKFKKSFPRFLGSSDTLRKDLERFYCRKIRSLESSLVNEGSKVKKWVTSETELEKKNQVNFFSLMLNGMPTILSKIENFSTVLDVISFSYEDEWDLFADRGLEKLSKSLSYEESVTFEPHQNKNYDDGDQMIFRFDINLGEWDRIQEGVGKLKVSYSFNLSESVIENIMKQLPLHLDSQYYEVWDESVRYLALFLKHPLKKLQEKFIIPPWKGDLENLLAQLILERALEMKKNKYLFSLEGGHLKEIKLEIYYGIYALKFFNYEFKLKGGVSTIDFF